MSDIRTRWSGWRLRAGGSRCWQVDVNVVTSQNPVDGFWWLHVHESGELRPEWGVSCLRTGQRQVVDVSGEEEPSVREPEVLWKLRDFLSAEPVEHLLEVRLPEAPGVRVPVERFDEQHYGAYELLFPPAGLDAALVAARSTCDIYLSGKLARTP